MDPIKNLIATVRSHVDGGHDQCNELKKALALVEPDTTKADSQRLYLVKWGIEFMRGLSKKLGNNSANWDYNAFDLSATQWLVTYLIRTSELPGDARITWVWGDPSDATICVLIHSMTYPVCLGGEAIPRINPVVEHESLIRAISTEHTVTPEVATRDKGYPHPGNTITIPDSGQAIKVQYGHPGEVGRNGCFVIDLLQAVHDHLSVYQQPNHPMACEETEKTLQHLTRAIHSMGARKGDRMARGVHQTDTP